MNPEKIKQQHELRIASINAGKEIAIAAISNPIIDFVGAIILLEYLEKKKATGWFTTGATEATVGTIATAQALAPLLPSLISAGGAAAGAATKLLPLLAGA